MTPKFSKFIFAYDTQLSFQFQPYIFFLSSRFFLYFFYDFQDLFSNMQKSNNKMIKIY
jgi:hypothetical protein